jgi:outer membrane protein, multidrug efflux system
MSKMLQLSSILKLGPLFSIFFPIFFPIFVLTTIAEFPTPSLALSWAEVQSKSLSTAPDLQLARANVNSADNAVDTAKASFYPTVSSSVTASRAVDSGAKRSSNTYGAGISVEQNLYSSGRDTAKVNAANSARAAASKEQKNASVILRAKLARAWNNAIYFQELSKIMLRNIQRRESNAQIVRLRYANGRENKGSVLKTESQTLDAKLGDAETSEKLTLAKGALSLLIGQPVSDHEPLVGSLLSLAVATQKETVLPTVAAKEAALQASLDSLTLARTQYLPTLGLSATARKSASPNLPLQAPVYSAELALNIPIFNAATSADVRSATTKTAAATLDLSATKLAQEQTIKVMLSAFEFAVKRQVIAKKNFEASELLGEISRKRYALGLGSFQDWNNYESEFMQSEIEVLSSEKSTADALCDYHEQIGVTLEETL